MKRLAMSVLMVGLVLGAILPAFAEQKEIVVWNLYSEIREELLNELAAEFEAETGVEVKVELFPTDPYKISLAAAFAAEEPPDIFFNWGGGILRSYVEAGAVAEITQPLTEKQWIGSEDIPWIEAFKPAGLTLSTYDGKNYGIPWALAGVGIFYNKAIFAEVGVELPETIWDLFEAIPAIRDAGYIPFTLGNKDRWPGAFYLIYLVDRLAVCVGNAILPPFWRWSTRRAEDDGNRFTGSPNRENLTGTVLCLFSGTNEGDSVS